MSSKDADVIVIGGGFAGITAARDLGDAGHSVLVLEGRDRLGGRTWYKPFGDQGRKVEFGGTWVAPRWQKHVGAEIERYGLPLVESPDPGMFAWSLGGERSRAANPIPVTEWLDFERAIRTIDNHAERLRFGQAPLDQPGLEDLDVPFTKWLAGLDVPPKTRDFILAWAGFYFGADPSEVSALHILSWVSGFDNHAVGWYVGVSEKLAGGTSSLIEAIAEDSGATIQYESPVRTIDASHDGARVTTRDGDTYSASAVVYAAPINTWHEMDIRPSLGEGKAAMAAERQAGHSPKFWALVKGLPNNLYAVGYDTAVKWMATEYSTPEGDLIVGFGTDPEELDITSHDAIVAAVKELVPEAEVVATDAHDWNADEFSQGTWMAYRPGQVFKYATLLQQAEGRIAFAGSDLASGWAGWMDGAVESGKRAAGQVREVLGTAVAA